MVIWWGQICEDRLHDFLDVGGMMETL